LRKLKINSEPASAGDTLPRARARPVLDSFGPTLSATAADKDGARVSYGNRAGVASESNGQNTEQGSLVLGRVPNRKGLPIGAEWSFLAIYKFRSEYLS